MWRGERRVRGKNYTNFKAGFSLLTWLFFPSAGLFSGAVLQDLGDLVEALRTEHIKSLMVRRFSFT
jgi:hypothetical protein